MPARSCGVNPTATSKADSTTAPHQHAPNEATFARVRPNAAMSCAAAWSGLRSTIDWMEAARDVHSGTGLATDHAVSASNLGSNPGGSAPSAASTFVTRCGMVGSYPKPWRSVQAATCCSTAAAFTALNCEPIRLANSRMSPAAPSRLESASRKCLSASESISLPSAALSPHPS